MKKMKSISFVAALLLASAATFAQQFEGVINMNTSNAEMKEEATVVWYLKDGKSRMDISSQADGHSSQYAVIADGKTMKMVSKGHVTDVPAAAMKVDLATQTLVSEQKGVSMNGYNCTQATYTDGKHQTTYWLTSDLSIGFDDIPFVISRNMPKINSSGFPVKMEKRDADGKVVIDQDVTSVSATQVDDSKFIAR